MWWARVALSYLRVSDHFRRSLRRRRLSINTIRGVTPDITVKERRVGGSTHQVPIEIGSTEGKTLAIRYSELVDAANGRGDAICKKEETHRMAEANRAFAHFR
ncbi:hypothetical protein M9H77_23620 [Catharanthus roseus]|uniref:Uncharacterized protein n=1 Tax=Catharanthus roseus TaxID=4058 RepID=A0ACC0AV27_CATRO|nr:hypothetical protein M9H77_23620 [Catharanthus roseus]